MSITRFAFRIIVVLGAAIAGNYVGDQMRARATGEKGHQFQVTHKAGEDTVVALNPNLTNVGPAVLAGLVLQPHVIWAFLGGVLASGLLGEKYEKKAGEWVKSQAASRGQPATEWIKKKLPGRNAQSEEALAE